MVLCDTGAASVRQCHGEEHQTPDEQEAHFRALFNSTLDSWEVRTAINTLQVGLNFLSTFTFFARKFDTDLMHSFLRVMILSQHQIQCVQH